MATHCLSMGGLRTAQTLYNKWENDRNRPNYEMLAKIAKELGTSTDYLIVGNNKNG